MPLNVGFVGGGAMCEAMLGGLLQSGAATPATVIVSEPYAARRDYLKERYKCQVTDKNMAVVDSSDVVVIAVKPQVLDAVLTEIQDNASKRDSLVLSIVAGKTLATFEKFLGTWAVARVMPNTPALVGAGAAAYVMNKFCNADHSTKVEMVMGACGIVEKVDKEELLDAVTGLSGSGPAYIYLMIEAMSDGGVRMGLPRATATRLAAQTVLGAGTMVKSTGKHPGELKDAVTSPGGTTIAAVHALEVGGFRGTVMNAVEAGTKRSRELAGL